MPSLAQYEATVEAYAEAQAELLEAVLSLLMALWAPFQGWNNPQLRAARVAEAVARASAAYEHAARLGHAFMREQLRQAGVDVDDLPDLEDIYPRSNVDITTVFNRPVNDALRELERNYPDVFENGGELPEDVQKLMRDRYSIMLNDDLQRAASNEGLRLLKAAPGAVGYRRVLHPELSRTGPCGLCVVAATRFYKKNELWSMHGRCVCGIAPIVEGYDPGLDLNNDELKALYDAAGSTYAEDLKRIRVVIREHGELGPILVREGHHFRNVSDVNDTTKYHASPFKEPTVESTRRMWERVSKQASDAIARLRREMPTAELEEAIQFYNNLLDTALAHLL